MSILRNACAAKPNLSILDQLYGYASEVGGSLFQGIQIDKLLYMKYYNMFILVVWIHCFVYISNGVVTSGYIHFVFIIFVLESMLLQAMYDGVLICFKYEDDSDAVDKRALQDPLV